VTFEEFAQKKVLGVPVLYVAGAAAVILLVVAYKVKPAAGQNDVPPDSGGAEDAAGTEHAADYSGLNTTGTVTVAPVSPSTQDDANPTVSTNQTWASKGAQFLTAHQNVPGSAALSALNKYLAGQDRSFDEQQWVDAVFEEYGPPPDGVDQGGKVGSKPAVKQFSGGSGTHTVVGGSDNSMSALAALYYNSTADDRIDLLEASNVSIGDGPWPAGTTVKIPAYHVPVIWTLPSNMTASQVAGKNGISLDQLSVLNDPRGGRYSPNYGLAKGTGIRVK
jgi:hypothetical protein